MARPRKKNHLVNGRRMSTMDIIDYLEIEHDISESAAAQLYHSRRRRGMSPEEIYNTPPDPRFQRRKARTCSDKEFNELLKGLQKASCCNMI